MPNPNCPFCGGEGKVLTGEICSCSINDEIELPPMLDVPSQYQGLRFDVGALNCNLPASYGEYMLKLRGDCLDDLQVEGLNILICAPPNSGKTVLAYDVRYELYRKGIVIPKPMDLMEVRQLLYGNYKVDYELAEEFSKARIVFIKIPLELPNRWAEIMSSIVERRVRANASTIFLYGGSVNDLLAQDTFRKFKSIKGNGMFNSILVKSWVAEEV